MAPERVMVKRVKQPIEKMREKINNRLCELQGEYTEEKNEYNVNYQWNGELNRIAITSDYISGEIVLEPKRLVVYAKVPFHLLPFKKKCLEILRDEVNKVVN